MKLPLTVMLTRAAFAPMDTARAGNVPAPVAEIVRFRLADGVTDTAFLDATRAMHPVVAAAPGFLSRSLSRNDDGSWTDYVVWTDLARAKSAAETVFAEPVTRPFMEAIDEATVEMRHEPIIWQME